MSYQVLARKYRPANFSQLVGQRHVVDALSNALTHSRLHHAYLFTGTRGVGKTTIARILAKSLNCLEGISATPCGKCEHCLDIDAGRFVDLIEVDAASRTKVEDTREILDNVQYAPSRGKYKVYLIDEVHMLSRHSFNALLKTLEEPPPHVVFLLATTDPQKLPVTVLSRCLQFNLKALTAEQISAHLSAVLTNESLQFTESALTMLAKAASGSIRDSLSLTDQAIAQGNGNVDDETVRSMLGLLHDGWIYKIAAATIKQEREQAFELFEKLSDLAPDFNRFLIELAELWHLIAMTQIVPSAAKIDSKRQGLVAKFARAISQEQLQIFYQITLQGRKDLQFAPDPKIGAEMTLLRLLAFQPLSGVVQVAETQDSVVELDDIDIETPVEDVLEPTPVVMPSLPAEPQADKETSQTTSEMHNSDAELDSTPQSKPESSPEQKPAPPVEVSVSFDAQMPVTEPKVAVEAAPDDAERISTLNADQALIMGQAETEGMAGYSGIVDATDALPVDDMFGGEAPPFDASDVPPAEAYESMESLPIEGDDYESSESVPAESEPLASGQSSADVDTVDNSAAEEDIDDILQARNILRSRKLSLEEEAKKSEKTQQAERKFQPRQLAVSKEGKEAPSEHSEQVIDEPETPSREQQSSVDVSSRVEPQAAESAPADSPPWEEQAEPSDIRAVQQEIISAQHGVDNDTVIAEQTTDNGNEQVESVVAAPDALASMSANETLPEVDATVNRLAAELDDWASSIDEMNLGGRLRQISIHSSINRDGNAITLHLSPEQKHLNTENARVQIEQAMQGYWQQPIELTIAERVPDVVTPFRIQQYINQKRQGYAEQLIADDPIVLALESMFAAKVKTESIRPL